MPSHALYWHHYTHSLYDITLAICMAFLHSIRHFILTLWHQTHYIWLHSHCICVITSTVFMISHKLYLWDLIRYTSWHHLHCIRHDSQWTCVITPILSMISHPLYGWHHTYTICIIYTRHKSSHSHFMISHHIIYDITCTVFMSSLPQYITLHPEYLCAHNPCK